MTQQYQSVMYAFTVTLKPVMFRRSIEEQYDSTYLELSTRLKSLPCKLTMICELTSNYNIHYHGIIVFITKSRSHEKDFKDLFRKSQIFGFTNIKQVDDFNGWVDYIKKDVTVSVKIINRPPVIIDEHDLFNVFDNPFMIQEELISDQ